MIESVPAGRSSLKSSSAELAGASGKSTACSAATSKGETTPAAAMNNGVDFFVSSLACVLTHLVSLRGSEDEVPHPAVNVGSTGNLTVFHAVREPNVSIQDYLFRIARYFLCSPECFVMALVYVDRIMKRHSDFIVCKLNIHRLIVTSMMLSVKFFDDVYYSNAYYAKVGGVRASEMNVLEAHFLKLIDWHLFVSPEEFDLYKTNVLVAVSGANTAGTGTKISTPPGGNKSPVVAPAVQQDERQTNEGYEDDEYDGFERPLATCSQTTPIIPPVMVVSSSSTTH